MKRGWVVGISGASGVIYGVRLVDELLSLGKKVHLVVSDAGWRVLADELGWNAAKRSDSIASRWAAYGERLVYYPHADIGAAIASGSFLTEGMVVCPCSMGTLSAIAHGASDNLLERAADVMLKEGRKLLVVPRETPLHAIHLENMLTLSKLGVKLIPAMPAFYHQPQSMDELVDFLVGKVLDGMEIEHALFKRWGEANGHQRTGTHRPD